jgi:hypothetical protein
MFKRVAGTVAVIVALVGSGFLFGQATADSQSTAAAAKPGSSQAVLKQLKKLNRKTASIDSGVGAIESNVGNVNRGIDSINTGIASIIPRIGSIDSGVGSINSAIGNPAESLSVRGLLNDIKLNIAGLLQIARICTSPTSGCF